MKVLVLGGAGYIGSHTVYELIAQGIQVVVIDNLETGFVKAVNPAAVFYKGDIRDIKFMNSVLKKESDIDVVIHLAESSQVSESMNDPLKYYDNNLNGTMNVLKVLISHEIDKIVISSTAAAYGNKDDSRAKESDIAEPMNVYGETKLSTEKMLKWVEQAHGIKFVSLRYFNVAGAHVSGKIGEAHVPETHLIPLVLQAASGINENICVFGTDYTTKDGTCVRDYIHVSDLARAHVLAAKYLMGGNQSNIFNLGTGVGFSVKEVIEMTEKVTGKTITVLEKERRAGDVATVVASSEKARKILGWNPQESSLKGIIQSAWRWHTNHPCGYQ
uniref:UDP-glucose 4-epimerase GalE n=1 Tax=Agathobacter sp. TaxID=2021311 RepID=UPI0040562958